MQDYVNWMCESILNNSLSSTEWMKFYEKISSFANGEDESIEIRCREFYDAVRFAFTSYAKTLNKTDYLVLISSVDRLSGYLARFWIPNNNLELFYSAGVNIWNSTGHEDDQIVVTTELQKPELRQDKPNFTLREVGILLEVIIFAKPKWFKIGVQLCRDDIYEGCQKLAPGIMKDVSWMDFWTLVEPLMCSNERGTMYITLRRFF